MKQVKNSDLRLVKAIISVIVTIVVMMIFLPMFKSYEQSNDLDITKIKTENTSLEERITYYDTIDKKIENMTEEQKDKYYVTIELNFSNFNEPETIVFTRNDERLVFSATTEENEIKLPPGIYKISTSNTLEILEEQEYITPGNNYSYELDYNSIQKDQ